MRRPKTRKEVKGYLLLIGFEISLFLIFLSGIIQTILHFNALLVQIPITNVLYVVGGVSILLLFMVLILNMGNDAINFDFIFDIKNDG